MRLRRKNSTGTEEVTQESAQSIDSAESAEAPVGPVDVADLNPDTVYIDLGSLLVPAESGLELRLQLDEESGTVLAALMVAEEGILEARAFAASRGGDLWTDARREIAADTARRGGTATEQDGPFGPELYCEVPVEGPDGEALIQPSRVIGYNGPRWFLRATIAGRPAQDADYATIFEDAIRSMGVSRGGEAMAPGEALPLRLPPEARPAEPADLAADDDA
jgi:hypothetical protein